MLLVEAHYSESSVVLLIVLYGTSVDFPNICVNILKG